MIDFLMISTRLTKRGIIEIYPKFIIKKSTDLMIRGGDFYAIWLEERGLWSTDEQDALRLIDSELDKYAKDNANRFSGGFTVLHMWDAESGMIDRWHKYCQKQMRDSFCMRMSDIRFHREFLRKSLKIISTTIKNGSGLATERVFEAIILVSKPTNLRTM